MDNSPSYLPPEFTPIQKIRQGLQSELWKAQGPDGTTLALKLASAEVGQQQILHEYHVLREAADAGIPQCTGLFRSKGHVGLAMEWIEGRSIDAWWPEASEATIQLMIRRVVEIIGSLHQRGLCHGDLKPEHILIVDDRAVGPTPCIIDFGLSVPLGTPLRGGTPEYFAPERLRDPTATRSVDLYALGLALLQAELGTPTPPTQAGIARCIAAVGSADLAIILPQCLEANPAKRWKSAESLMARLPPLRGQMERPRIGLLPHRGHNSETLQLVEQVQALVAGDPAPVNTQIVGALGSGRQRLIREARLRCVAIQSNIQFLEWVEDEVFHQFAQRIFRACGWLHEEARLLLKHLTPSNAISARSSSLIGQRLAALIEDRLDGRIIIWFGTKSPGLDSAIRSCIDALQTSEQIRERQQRKRRFLFWMRQIGKPHDPLDVSLESAIYLQPLRPLHYQEILERLFPESEIKDRNDAAQHLWSRTQGNPGTLNFLLRGLLARGSIRPRQVGAFLAPQAVDAVLEEGDQTLALELLSRDAQELAKLLSLAPLPLTRRSVAMAAPQEVQELSRLVDLQIVRERLDPRGGSPRYAIARSTWARVLRNLVESDKVSSLHHRLCEHAPSHAQAVWHQAHTAVPPLVTDVRKAATDLCALGQTSIALTLVESLLARSKADPAFKNLGTPDLHLCLAELKGSAGLLEEARAEFLRICSSSEGSEAAFLAKLKLSKIAAATGQIKEALELAKGAAESIPNPALHQEAYTIWAAALFTAGRLEEALSKAIQAGPPPTADNFGMRGYILSRLARDGEAITAFCEAQRLLFAESRSDEAEVIGVNIALIEMRQGLLDQADERFVRAEKACRKLGMPLRQAQVMTNRAILLSRQGHLEQSAHLHSLAAERLEEIGEPIRAEVAYASRGLAELAQGHFGPALSILSKVERSLTKSGAWPRAHAQALAGLATCYLRTGRRKRARQLCARGLRMAYRMNDITCLGVLYEAAEKLSRRPEERRSRMARWQRNVDATKDAKSTEALLLARAACALRDQDISETRSWLSHDFATVGLEPQRRLLAAHAYPETRGRELALGLRSARRMRDRWSEWQLGVQAVTHLLKRKRQRAAQRLFTRCAAVWTAMETEMTERQKAFFRVSEAGGTLRKLSEQIESELGALASPNEQRTVQSRVELLSLIALLNSEDDENAIIRNTLDGLIRMTGAEGAYLILRNRDDSLDFSQGRLLSGDSAEHHAQHVSTTLIHEVLADKKAVIVANAAADPRYRGLISVSNNELHAVACVPLLSHGMAMGVVWIDGGTTVPYFETSDIPLLEGFAHCAALALSASRRRSNTVAKLEEQQAQAEVEARRNRVASTLAREMIGTSAKFQQAKALLLKAAQSELPVHICGESGTGKELFAARLHAESSRKSGSWVAVNAAAIPEGLAESELFGFERGAFSGAGESSLGLIRQAEGGTLFIDEVGEMPLSIQARLLRVLQEKEVRPVGGSTVTKVDFRLVTSSRHDLAFEVESGRFREDLWFRIKTIAITIPPLRLRKDDIIPLAKCFLIEQGKSSELTSETQQALLAAPWPGNVRELQNVMARAALLSVGPSVELQHLGPELSNSTVEAASGSQTTDSPSFASSKQLPSTMAEWEDLALETALRRSGGDRKEAARLLGISRTTLYAKLKRFGPGT